MERLNRLRALLTGKIHGPGPEQGLRADPECVVLPASEAGGSPHPPVRIFLGTEPAQSRAERVFFYSVERHRDPGREYRIYRMTGLRGFDTRRWRTNFTMYRYAIPEFAGFSGRAIYNDVDQVYTDDPANLFDLPMQEHGYLSISPEDTSVMLIDCERMARHWNREQASTRDKKALAGKASETRTLWGRLDGHWNARDTEYCHGVSSLVHFTALHLQPWQPTPEQYTYYPNPLREVWLSLEREADERRYECFSAESPSALYRGYAERIGGWITPGQALRDLPTLRPGPDGASHERVAVLGIAAPLQSEGIELSPLDIDGAANTAAVAVPAGTVDGLPVEDVPWVLERLFATAEQALMLAATCDDDDAGMTGLGRGQSRHWWLQLVRRMAARHAHTGWRLELRDRAGRRVLARQARSLHAESAGTPRVWLLYGQRPGDNAQIRALGSALGWPLEEKQLVFNRLSALPAWLLGSRRTGLRLAGCDRLGPPWPDVVIATGRRAAPVARWIRRRSAGRCRLVHLGRPWCRLGAFDYVVTTPQYQLPLADNVHCNTLPLNRPPEGGAGVPGDWRTVVDSLPTPRVCVLVGGDSRPYRFDHRMAAALAAEVNAAAGPTGGSALVVTGRRCSDDAYRALISALKVPHAAYHPRLDTRSNPYGAFLELADRVVVTGDSVSMLADACATGKPVTVQAPGYGPDLRDRAAAMINRLLTGRTRVQSHRGTPRQQDWRGRLHARLITSGLLTSVRDPSLIHEELFARGLVDITPRPDREPPRHSLPLADELGRTARDVRRRVVERLCD